MAKAVLIASPISPKHCIEICNLVRKKPLDSARKILEDVVDMKKPIPFKRFNSDVGHKKGMGPGRYPVKAAQAILDLMDSVEANAQFKGLNTGNLFIRHISTQRAARPMRFGRQRGLLGKRSTVELVVEEKAIERKEKGAKVEKKNEVKSKEKPVVKPEPKKEEPKEKPVVAKEAKTETKPEEKKIETPKVKEPIKKEESKPKPEVKVEEKPVVAKEAKTETKPEEKKVEVPKESKEDKK